MNGSRTFLSCLKIFQQNVRGPGLKKGAKVPYDTVLYGGTRRKMKSKQQHWHSQAKGGGVFSSDPNHEEGREAPSHE